MAGVKYDPKPGALPNVLLLAQAKGLWGMTFESPFPMIELREAFKQAGLRQQEREITYAIERMRTRRANPIEGGLRYILFEVTSDYGLSYGRPLLIILGLILAFAFPYMAAIRRPGRGKVVRVDPEAENVTTTVVGSAGKAVGMGIYFSLLSAFHLGWRDLNVGNWIIRLQPREFFLRGEGWVRTVSGIQSLISVFLVALWVLTYFGRPFE